jgi:hypothetical protein
MAETVGVSTIATLPNDPVELLKLLIVEVRVLQFMLYEGVSRGDDPAIIRANLRTGPEIVVS